MKELLKASVFNDYEKFDKNVRTTRSADIFMKALSGCIK
jgi:hypothetical protein